MSCDIHLHTEVKIKGHWHHYGAPDVPRSYALFSRMADVGNNPKSGIAPIALPKGLPADVSAVTSLDAEKWNADGHSFSWLNAEEIALLSQWMKDDERFQEGGHFGYLFGGYWSDWIDYPNERPKGIEDIRFVFWFDS